MNLGYQVVRIRMVEERIIELYPSDKIQSPVHLSIGQEAVAVGICQSLRPTDLLFATYRSHAFYLAKGGNLNQMFAELYGKATGCCGGKGGSMHLAAPEVGFMGTSAIVASSIPHAVGAAHAAKLLNKDQIVVAVFGDGAVDEGVYHESLNYASLHALPVIFVCEDNGLAVHSHKENRQSFDIVEHVKTYGIPATHCSGHDPWELVESFNRVIDGVRYTRSPQFILIDTYREMEHVGISDDHSCTYRSVSELEKWKTSETWIDSYSGRDVIKQEIDDAVAFAETSPYPTEVLSDV